MAQYRLIEQLELVGDGTPAAAGGRPAGPELLRTRAFRLPSFARDYTFHLGDPQLARALKPLQGKFTVVNPTVVVPLPAPAQQRVSELLRPASDAPAGAVRGTLALHEPVQPEVRHEARGTTPSTMPGRDILFWAELRYRVVVATDRAGERAGAAPAAAAPVQWFHAALLVPDADALRQMTAPTAHFYRHVTGRLGGGSRDCYWYLDAWERFHEAGQVIGCVSPDLVSHGHVGGAVRARTHGAWQHAPPTLEELLFGDDAAVPRATQYTPHFDRRGFVPPGYCLVHYFATVEVVAARRAHAGAAA